MFFTLPVFRINSLVGVQEKTVKSIEIETHDPTADAEWQRLVDGKRAVRIIGIAEGHFLLSDDNNVYPIPQVWGNGYTFSNQRWTFATK